MRSAPARVHHLLHSADLIDRRLATLLAPMDIRPRQARVLNILSRVGAVTQSTLAQEMGVTAGSMSTMVKRLLATGLIRRDDDESDGRADALSLTEAGRRRLKEVRKAWQALDATIAETLGAKRADLLAVLLADLKIGLGGHVPGSGWAQRSRQDPHRHYDLEKADD